MIELEVIPACQSYGVSIIPWSPLGGGLLGGVLQKVAEGRRADARMQERIEKHRAQLEAYEGFCREIGERPADVALAWLLRQPAVTAPIIGPRTLDQLNDSLRALEITLNDEALARLDAIWPGPGGPAPEAYAW
jgi:Predicted oxidoreductases (related to aryl-alcohol dehydrogenases)